MLKKKIPYLQEKNGKVTLMVNDEPFLVLGGELHNSSGSNLDYLAKKVWPGLKKLGGNCFLTPVYWECLEPEPGRYDFSLVDGVIAQAREEGVHLILLWFGLWKNGRSSYVPAWMKKNTEYFYMRGIDGQMIESVSPFCDKAVELDAKAFTEFMKHLRKIDEERTVIMVQVENEIGVWNHPRDYGSEASEIFEREVPDEISKLYDVSGSWEDAFGLNACEYFMSWAFSKAVGKIAESGKAVYELPLFMNCVAVGIPLRAGQVPSGGPLPRVHKIWRAFAPAIDLYGPDIYSPFYKEVCDEFAQANALIVPELTQDKNAASKALYTVAAYNTICFSPFGIEEMFSPIEENDLLSQINSDAVEYLDYPGKSLAEVYRILNILWKDIRTAQEENNIYAFLQQGSQGEEFFLEDYIIQVSYGDGGMRGNMGESGYRKEGNPCGGGFILRMEQDRFLVCGISCNIQVIPKYASRDSVFIMNKRELYCTENGLLGGRILNGDERNFMAIGSWPSVQELTIYQRKWSKDTKIGE